MQTLLLFHPLAVLILSVAGLLLCGFVAISTTARSIVALLPLTPMFLIRLVGIGIVMIGLNIVKGADTLALRCTAAQRHAASLQHRFNF